MMMLRQSRIWFRKKDGVDEVKALDSLGVDGAVLAGHVPSGHGAVLA